MARKNAELLLAERDDTEIIDFFDTNTGTGKNTTEATEKAEALADALKDADDAYITIHKSSGGNLPEEFVSRVPADKFDVGQIQEYLLTHYGGGDYRVRLYLNKKIKQNKLFSIATPIDKTGTTPAGEAAGILSVVLNRLESQQKQMMMLMQQSQTPPTSRTEFFQELILMKQIFGNDGGNKSTINELLGTIEALKTLGIQVGNQSEKEESDGFGTLLEKMAPLVEAAVSHPRQPTEEQKVNQMNMMQSAILKAKIEPFIKAAIKNSDPAIYADMLCDQMDEAQIKGYLLAPDSMDKLMTIDKRLPALRPWFELLVEHVKACLGMESTVSGLYDNEETGIDDAPTGGDLPEHE
jgi:hypothetical protein